MPRIRHSAVGHQHYLRNLYPIGFAFNTALTDVNSTANDYYASPLIVPARCTLRRIGIRLGSQTNSGNMMLGFHDSDGDPPLPNNRVAQTASIAVAALSIRDWHWYTPTTEPTLRPGFYYVGWIDDTIFSDGVAGFQVYQTSVLQTTVNNTLFDGVIGSYSQAVGAFSVPDPFIEVEQHVKCWALGIIVEVT